MSSLSDNSEFSSADFVGNNNPASLSADENGHSGVPLSLDILQEGIRGTDVDHELNETNARQICKHVETINLEFKRIGSLELAWILSNVTDLCLSNNELRSTKGLQSLHKLKFLDLSFNKINDITHVKNLTKLEVLCVHHNQISNIEEDFHEHLRNLEVLTLGCNRIKRKKDVLLLRNLLKLGSLTLKGNPFCSEDYRLFTISHLPRLVYLDFQKITKEEKRKSAEKFRDSIARVSELSEQKSKQTEELTRKAKEEEEHRRAGVSGLKDDTLFRKLFEGDLEMKALTMHSDVQSLIDRFQEQFRAVCTKLFDEGVKHSSGRIAEKDLVKMTIDEAQNDANESARRLVNKLNNEIRSRTKTREVKWTSPASAQNKQDLGSEDCIEVLTNVKIIFDASITELTENEIVLANQIQNVLEKAEKELGTMVDIYLAEASCHFEELQRLCYGFYCRLKELTTKLTEATEAVAEANYETVVGTNIIVKGSRESESTSVSEVSKIFEGSDTLTAALARIHDSHLTVINNREEELKSHLHSWLQDELKEFHRLEWLRHRKKIQEISDLSTQHLTSISRSFGRLNFQEMIISEK